MKRMIRAAASAVVMLGGLGSVGCVSTGAAGGSREDGHGPIGDCWRNHVDPCYPERYQFAARQAVVAPFAQQVHNGDVLNKTIFNHYFEFGTDTITVAGIEKLNSLARTRPAPDPELFIQTARDFPANTDPTKLADLRTELDAKRAAVIQQYLASQPTFAPVAYKIYVHDPIVPSIYAEMALRSYNGSLQGYRGGVTGGGTGVLGTGGGQGGNITGTPNVGTGGAFGSGSFGNPTPGTGSGTGGTGR